VPGPVRDAGQQSRTWSGSATYGDEKDVLDVRGLVSRGRLGTPIPSWRPRRWQGRAARVQSRSYNACADSPARECWQPAYRGSKDRPIRAGVGGPRLTQPIRVLRAGVLRGVGGFIEHRAGAYRLPHADPANTEAIGSSGMLTWISKLEPPVDVLSVYRGESEGGTNEVQGSHLGRQS